MTFHVFIGCLCTCDLNELNDDEHCEPGELESGPNGDGYGEGIFVIRVAEAWGEDVAFSAISGGKGSDVYHNSLEVNTGMEGFGTDRNKLAV